MGAVLHGIGIQQGSGHWLGPCNFNAQLCRILHEFAQNQTMLDNNETL